jgi:hypothetical protein
VKCTHCNTPTSVHEWILEPSCERDDYDEESQFTTDFNFIDEGGEVVWVHTKEMALISVPEQLIARERTAEEWDAMTAEMTPVTAPTPVVVPKPKRRTTKPTTRPQ